MEVMHLTYYLGLGLVRITEGTLLVGSLFFLPHFRHRLFTTLRTHISPLLLHLLLILRSHIPIKFPQILQIFRRKRGSFLEIHIEMVNLTLLTRKVLTHLVGVVELGHQLLSCLLVLAEPFLDLSMEFAVLLSLENELS